MIAVVTGAGGLVGSEAVLYFASKGYEVVGIDNDFRALYFGTSTAGRLDDLKRQLSGSFAHVDLDIRDTDGIRRLFAAREIEIALVIHAAAQPSHDYAASHPMLDFTVNALGTANLLEATRQHAPEAVFIFVSTNKVYGDRPNALAMVKGEMRYEPVDSTYWHGFDENLSIDTSLHSLFGASKVAADVLVQEYGRYYGMQTACFRAGCLTGRHHAGAEQHGFLAYLMKCVQEGRPYTIYGYGGRQVRDNLHALDLVRAFDVFTRAPRRGAVYNIGGGRQNSASVLEAIALCEEIAGRKLDYAFSDEARKGDHRWWITDNGKFQEHYPGWEIRVGLEEILTEMALELA